jgi:hypothetical protein
MNNLHLYFLKKEEIALSLSLSKIIQQLSLFVACFAKSVLMQLSLGLLHVFAKLALYNIKLLRLCLLLTQTLLESGHLSSGL